VCLVDLLFHRVAPSDSTATVDTYVSEEDGDEVGTRVVDSAPSPESGLSPTRALCGAPELSAVCQLG
jgi:hypothetical protein